MHILTARCDWTWRLIMTATAFAGFGICGAIFSLALFPLLVLWPHRASRQRAVTAVIHIFFRLLVGVLRAVGVMTLEVSGVEALRAGRPAVVVANHPTYLDVVVLLSLLPRGCCVVKGGHWRNPCMWGIVRAAEYLSNADPSALVRAGARQLAAGYTIIVFPEGSRSPARDRLHPFSRGFAHMALEADVPVVPVLIDCDPPTLTKSMRWYHVPARRFRMRIAVLEPLEPDALVTPEVPCPMAVRTLTRTVETHITEHLLAYGFIETRN